MTHGATVRPEGRSAGCRGRITDLFTLPTLVMSLVCSSVFAESTPAASFQTPVVLMVRVGSDPAARQMESRFITDLGLYIDDFSIEEIPPPSSNYIDSPLSEQIALIKPIMERRRAAAAMWLQAASEDVLLLQVVVLDTGRALVRLFEHSLVDEDSEAALAVTAAELLGTAYLFDSAPAKRPASIKKLVDKTRKKARAPRRSWRLALIGAVQWNFLEQQGPALRPGGALGGERAFLDTIFLSGSIGGAGGPLGRDREPIQSGYEIFGSVDLFWGPRLSRINLGPMVMLRGGPCNIRVKHSGHPKEDFAYWHFYAGLGAALRVALTDKVALKFAAGIGINANRLHVVLASTGGTAHRTGLLGTFGTFSVLLF